MFSILKMEMSIGIQPTTRSYIPENRTLHAPRQIIVRVNCTIQTIHVFHLPVSFVVIIYYDISRNRIAVFSWES
jgi:hypothetical protein